MAVSVEVLELVTGWRFNSPVVIIEINPDVANRPDLAEINGPPICWIW